jgi:hypothetical protein
MLITDDHMSRTFAMLDHAAKDPNVPASKLFYRLSDCWPTGKRMDSERATMKQLYYICDLAEFTGYKEPFSEGWSFLIHAQGHAMSKTQAGHIIAELLA